MRKLAFIAAVTVFWAQPAYPKKVTMASLPCSRLLTAYNTRQDEAWTSSIVEDVSAMDSNGVLGSNINIKTFVLTECRLNEGFTVGQAVAALFSASNSNNLPPIPIGGATSDPKVQSEWVAFDRWLKHQGPKPHYSHDR